MCAESGASACSLHFPHMQQRAIPILGLVIAILATLAIAQHFSFDDAAKANGNSNTDGNNSNGNANANTATLISFAGAEDDLVGFELRTQSATGATTGDWLLFLCVWFFDILRPNGITHKSTLAS